jgi:phosphoserine phosphatase
MEPKLSTNWKHDERRRWDAQSYISKNICVSDWDGTLRPGFIIVDWIDYLSKTLGLTKIHSSQIASIVSRYVKKGLSYNEFAANAVTIYAETLCGQSTNQVQQIADLFVQKDVKRLFPFAIELLRLIKHRGYSVFILSGAPLIPILSYAKLIPIDGVFALDVLRDERGVFTDKPATNYALAQNKRRAIEQLQSKGFHVTVAFGDTESDKPFLEVAKYPFFVLQSPKVNNYSEYFSVTPDTIISTVNKVVPGGNQTYGHNHE